MALRLSALAQRGVVVRHDELRFSSLRRRHWLRDLAVVPVDGHRLQTHLPGVHVQLLDVLDADVLR